MGSNLARNFASKGHTVAIFNRSPEKTRAVVDEFGHEGNFVPAETIEDFVASLERPRKAVIMVQAGAATDAVIAQLVEAMDEGDIIIDGGNALFTDTIRREREVAAARATAHGPPRRSARQQPSAQASRRPAGPSPRHR